jgi:diguanylate cyclase (GGDEF)-like protein/PAS domain S-box-containing protein
VTINSAHKPNAVEIGELEPPPAAPSASAVKKDVQLMDHLTVGIVHYEYSLDYGWFQRSCNETYLKMLGREGENMQGLPVRQLFPKTLVDDIEKKLSDCRDQKMIIHQHYELKKNSMSRFLRVDVQPMPKTAAGADQVAVTVYDVTSERNTEKQLITQGLTDELTGLHNRMYFSDRIDDCVKKSNTPFAILLIDIDRFQYVNETLGHTAGDELLITMARRLLTCLRGKDILARLSSDEFGILIQDVASLEDAKHVSERIHRAMMKPFKLSGQDVFVSTSIGITVSDINNQSPDDMLRDADFAMHHAKKSGRSCTQVYQTEQHSKAKSLFQMESDLRKALERDELSLVYQPIVRLTDSRVTSFEALMRWNKSGAMIPPNDFIPVAEDTGLIVPMGRWAIKTAATQAAMWRNALGEAAKGLRIAINVSAVQLARDDVIGALRESFEETGLDGSYLTMELTESSLVNNPQQARDLLHEMKALNLHLALDDFGTGYSSLSYLTSFPIDIVKIDRSFITKMLSNEQDYQIVLAILTLARNLGKRVVAEGIELTTHLEELRDMGCDYGQGYLFSKPLQAGEAGKLIVA